jgi:hypothetical protein
MKTRAGFVSNSSSLSFVLLKKVLTEHQINKILEINSDDWVIRECEKFIEGTTIMDNFDMEDYFEKNGFPKEFYKFDDRSYSINEDDKKEILNYYRKYKIKKLLKKEKK